MTTIKVINSCADNCQTSPADRQDCVFATVAVDEQQGKDVGCLILNDTAVVCNSSTGSTSATALAAAAAADGLGYRQSSSLYVQQLQAEEGPVLLQLLQQAFARMPYLQQALLVSDLDFDADIQQRQQQQQQQLQAPVVPDTAATLFAKATRVGDTGPWLYECSRQLALPPLQVKHARVEDHDDLLPIVAAAAAGPWPSLAALPQSCEPDQPYALTRLISSQDSQNLVLVAEDEGRTVGLLVATLQLDASLLIQSFDLGFCDAFMPPEVYEECETAARHRAADKAAQRAAGDEGAPAMAEPTAEEIREELVPLLLSAFAKRQQQQNRSSKSAAAAAPHNLAAITMLCMQPGYEDRAVDFLPSLFAEFQQQEYCALTLPHSAAQPQLAQHMTLLRPVPGSSFPQVVLLLHRASLALHMGADWEVRLAVPDDVVGLHGLLDGLSNATDLQEAFLHAVGPQGAVVAAVNGEMVAMLASSPGKADLLDSWSARFRLDQGLPVGSLAEVQQHAQVEACVINPVFSACAGAMLAGSLKLLNKAYLHYLLRPGQPAPAEVLAVMQQQRSRNSSAGNAAGGAQQESAGGALFSFAKGMAHAPRHTVNAQIVIAGASDTGLSCLEHLLLQPHARFTHLTLLAPGGVRTDSIASQMTAARVARMGLHANVTIVESHMVALDVQQQVLVLADGGQLPYDLVAVTTGLQDQLAPAVAGAFPEAAQFVLSAQQLMSSSITPELAAGLRSVLVYGADLQAFDVLATLIGTGVDAGAITWVCPGAEQEAPSMHLLRRLALQLGLELPEPQQGRLLDLVPSADGTRAVAALQGLDAGDDGPLQQMELDLLVGCGSLQPSAIEASCLAGAHIVWDGRLVVDAQLFSSDASVMGAGPGAKFSRRYTLPEVRHEHYNSCELGVALADSIIKRLLPAHDAAASSTQHTSAAHPNAAEAIAVSSSVGQEQHQQQDAPAGNLGPQQDAGQSIDQLPALKQAKVLGCRMPGGHVFLSGCTAAAAAGPEFTPPPGGCTLVSSSSDKASAIAITLDAASTVHQVSFLGAAASVDASTAAGLVRLAGIPFSYLAAGLGLPDTLATQLAGVSQARGTETAAGWDSGLHDDSPAEGVPAVAPAGLTASPDSPGVWLVEQDLLAALQQPWARLLFHEDFKDLRKQLLGQEAKAQGPGEQLEGAYEQQVQQLAVEFMRSCRAELAGYHVHGSAGGGVAAGC